MAYQQFEDVTIDSCRDCKQPFVFEGGEQAFFAKQDPPWTPPVRCKDCRAANKVKREKRMH